MISTFSSSASSSSHSDALKKPRGLRLHVFCAKAQRRTAAVHGGVANADDQNTLADGLGVLEGDRLEPLDTDVDAVRIVAPGDLEVLALGGAGADENGVVALVEQRFHALDAVIQSQVHAHIEDVTDLLVEYVRRQPELRDIRAHQSTGGVERFEDGHFVTQRTQVVRHGQRGTACADQRDLFAIALVGSRRQSINDVIPVIGGDAFQSTDRNGLVFDAAPATGRLAGAIANAAEDSREHVRLAILHVGIAEPPLGNQADIFRHVGMSRTAVLAVDDLMEILGIGDVSRLHQNRARITGQPAH
jgi:hypothetical protein